MFLKTSFTPFQEEILLDSAETEGAVLGLRGKKNAGTEQTVHIHAVTIN